MRAHELLRDDAQPIGIDIGKVGRTTPKQQLIRLLFGAGLATAAALIGIAFGPRGAAYSLPSPPFSRPA